MDADRVRAFGRSGDAGLSLLIGRSISKALASMVSAMTRRGRRRVQDRDPRPCRKDEIGEMAGAVEVFKNNMIEAERLARRTARGRARRPSSARRTCANSPMRSRARSARSSETVSTAATELEASANTLTKAADRSQHLATAVAAASEEASTNVQSVSPPARN
jgi:methyl-accepting chemotaxis protein